jgi:AraC-like DNA-binding protein
MFINSSIIIGILKSLESNGHNISDYININTYKHALDNEMTDASLYFQLVTDVRKLNSNIEKYASVLQYINLLDIGILGHFLYSCKSIFVAYDRMIKYQLLISNFINIKYNHIDNEIHWVLQMPYQLYKDKYDMEAIADFELLLRFKIEQSLSNKTPQPKKIELFHNSAETLSSRINYFSRKFDCDVVPNRMNNIIIYDDKVINKEIPYRNFELYKNMDTLLLKKIPELYKKNEHKNTIKSILINNFEDFPLSIDEVSKRLFMSSRKLQFILQQENTSYQTILNEIKIFIAIEHLKRKKEIKEIASKLGYKEPNSFTRFFIQHTQINPYHYSKLSEKEKQILLKKWM